MGERKGIVREFHFVDMDDPNRYKRLKVLRACDFCRKRKVKLVTQNLQIKSNQLVSEANIRMRLHIIDATYHNQIPALVQIVKEHDRLVPFRLFRLVTTQRS